MLDAELLPAWARDVAPMPGEAAQDSGDARRHPTMRSQNISSTRGPVTAAGIPSYPPKGTGDRPCELLEHHPRYRYHPILRLLANSTKAEAARLSGTALDQASTTETGSSAGYASSRCTTCVPSWVTLV